MSVFKIFKKSDYFLLGAALFSFIFSVSLWFSGYKQEGLYVGIWVPSILGFASYFKIVVRNHQQN